MIQDGSVDGTRIRLKRDEILDIASTEFARTGYRGTNLGQVSDALGVTRQAIYYYFPKKHDLLIALFERFFDLLEAGADAADDAEPPGRARFDAMLRSHLRIVATDPTLSSIFGEGRGNLPPAASDHIQARRKAYNARIVGAYQAGIDAGELDPEVPATVAVDLLIGAANWVHRWFNPKGRMSPDDLAERGQRFLAGGYAKK